MIQKLDFALQGALDVQLRHPSMPQMPLQGLLAAMFNVEVVAVDMDVHETN
jgi:hypothetical protein